MDISILLVDDEFIAREDIKSLLDYSELGFYFVGEASNGKDGCELYRQTHADLIITDIKMPVMTGLEMIDALSEEDEAPEFILLTAYEDFGYARQAMKLEVRNYILKHEVDSESLKGILLSAKERITDKKQRTRYLGKAHTNAKRSITNPHIIKAIRYIDNNYARDITLKSVAAYLNINEVYAGQLFKKELNVSFKQYLAELRVDKAKALLNDDRYKIYEISEMVGYQTVQYFCNTFKKLTGMNPSEYSQRRQGDVN